MASELVGGVVLFPAPAPLTKPACASSEAGPRSPSTLLPPTWRQLSLRVRSLHSGGHKGDPFVLGRHVVGVGAAEDVDVCGDRGIGERHGRVEVFGVRRCAEPVAADACSPQPTRGCRHARTPHTRLTVAAVELLLRQDDLHAVAVVG